MDLQERLGDYIESLNTGIPLFNEFNDKGNSVPIYTIAGGRTVVEYMDGAKDKELNYELQVKVNLNDRNKGLTALNKISKGLEELETLESADGSFKFKKIKVSSDPYLMDVTNDNNIYFRFTFIVSVNIKPKGEI